MTSLHEPALVVRRPRRPSRRRSRRRPVMAVALVVVLAALAAYVWRTFGDPGPSTTAGVLSEGVAAPTAAPTEAAPPTTAPTTLPPTTVPQLTVGPLEAKGRPVPVVFRIGTYDPVVFFTVDDGGIQRPELVDYIRSSGIPITMFLTERYSSGTGVEYFQQLQGLGATVQAHSVTHASLRGKPLEFQTQEVCGPVDTYERNYGVRPRYFRPPYGNYDTNTLRAAASCGLKAVLWWSATYNNGSLALQEGQLRRGEIILLHFNDNLTSDLQSLLAQVQAAGLRPALLDDYLDAAPVAP